MSVICHKRCIRAKPDAKKKQPKKMLLRLFCDCNMSHSFSGNAHFCISVLLEKKYINFFIAEVFTKPVCSLESKVCRLGQDNILINCSAPCCINKHLRNLWTTPFPVSVNPNCLGSFSEQVQYPRRKSGT